MGQGRQRQFGRLYLPDERDKQYPMKKLFGAEPRTLPIARYWKDYNWVGNQHRTPRCVGFAWTHWLESDPVVHNAPSPVVWPAKIYNAAQKIDEWPGENYDGTSVRAGAKVLQSMGFISSYYWAETLWDIVRAVLERGPVVVGTNWYSGMSDPGPDGIMRASGYWEGGHAYLLTSADRRRKRFRIRNSWGTGWGRQGRAFLPFATMRRLLAEDGEACIATEIAT